MVRSIRCYASTDQLEVGVSDPLKTGLCFLQPPLPASPTASLAVGLPKGQGCGLTTFLADHTTEAGSVYSPVVCLGDAFRA